MATGSRQLTDGDTANDSPSRIEPKRSHQWFADANDSNSFPNKKQEVQASYSKSTTELLNPNAPPLGNSSGFFPSVPSQFMDRLFGTETNRPFDFTEPNISPFVTDNSNVRRKGISDQLGNDSSVDLSISQTMEESDACFSYGGIRKVKVNQVKDSGRGFHAPEVHNNGIGTQAYVLGNETSFIPMGNSYDKEGERVILMDHARKCIANMGSVGFALEKGYDNNKSIGHSYTKGDSNTISFGGFQEHHDIDPLDRPLNGYELIYNQSSVQTSGTPNKKELDASTASASVNVSRVAKPRPESVSKSKSEPKGGRKEKEAPNTFPWNVKTLISTGMFDGVPVKYVSLSQEELCGIIKGTGYLCACQSCNFSKVLNAYEFERHAGCKTKHPNDHIYFENGKSIYQVVQELRSTPESRLFDAIQTITGSPINQNSFRIWKESFLAATRELQRIYGKDSKEDLNL
ncbi:hypothetical protein U1Q18_042216 [Sarracenia purpurea var. burkii]